MAGFRLTGGSDGCPPTEAPPASYTNPFRFDAAGRLWITSCFKGFRYFGAARHDLSSPVAIGTATAPVSTPPSGDSVTAGTYRNVTVLNDTECTMGILLGLDANVDMTTQMTNVCSATVTSQWQGGHHSLSAVSNPTISGSTAFVRKISSVSANPHDLGFEDGAAPVLTLAPGASGVVSSKLFLSYTGTPGGFDILWSAYTAVRIYGYILS
jgi:hypothetical protein